MATREVEGLIEKRISLNLNVLLKQIGDSGKITAQVAANVQRFRPSDRTAELLGRIVTGNAADLDRLNTDLRNQIQELDRKITEAATNFLDSTKDAEKKCKEAEERSKAAEESRKQFEEKTMNLTEERAQLEKLIKKNEEQAQNIAGIKESLEECLIKLNEDRESARKKEKFAEDMEKQIKDQTANQDKVMTVLQDQYKGNVTKLENEIARLTEKLALADRMYNDTSANLAQVTSANTNSTQIQQSQAVQMEKINGENRCRSEKQELVNIHKQELERMYEAHTKEIERLEATHASRVSEITTEKDKIEKKQQILSQEAADLREDITKAETEAKHYKAELDQKKEEYRTTIMQFWNDSAGVALSTWLTNLANNLDEGHKEIARNVQAVLKKYEHTAESVGQSNTSFQSLKNEMTKILRNVDQKFADVANTLSNEVANAKDVMSRGGVQAGELKLTQEQYATSLRAIKVLEEQATHRDKVDQELWDMQERTASSDYKHDRLVEENEELDRKVGESYDKVQRFDEMEKQLNALKSTSTDETNKLLDEREELLEKIRLAAIRSKDFDTKLAELERMLDEKQKDLDAKQKDLDECNQHRLTTDSVDNANIARLEKEVQELKKQLQDCQRALGANEVKAGQYDLLMASDGALQRLDTRVSQLEQQHSSRDDTLGGLGRRTSSRLAAREATPTTNLASRRGAIPPGISTRGGTSPTPDIQVTSETGPMTTSSTTPGSFMARAQAATAASTNRANAIASQPRAASRAGPTTPVTSSFQTTSTFGSIKGQKRSRESGNTPDKFGKLHKSTGAIAGGHAGLQPDISPLRTQTGTRDRPMDVDSPGTSLSGLFTLPEAFEQVRLGAGSRRSTEPETRQESTTEVAATVEATQKSVGTQGSQTQEQGSTQDERTQGQGEGQDDQAQDVQESAEARIAGLRNGTVLPHSNWPGPNVAVRTSTGSNADTSAVSSADKLFGAVKKPSNWDSTANQDFLRLIRQADNMGRLVDVFHRQPACISARTRRNENPIPEDRTDRCSSCIKKNDVCWGVKKLPDTQPPTGSANQKKSTIRLNMVRNVDGHYWEAVYRPARGPGGNDDGATGGGTGGISAA